MEAFGELETIVRNGVPEEALRFFGRWWQFETYLREVVYVELRCRYGEGYAGELGVEMLKRIERDRVNDYMASADAADPLAYLDAGALMGLIGERWELFGKTLLPRDRWQASSGLLRELRNRVSHCRRPHIDDLGRLLQFLRDLEHGARHFYTTYNETGLTVPVKDPLAKAWLEGRHADAERLLEHAKRQYDTSFHLRLSRRPWAADNDGEPVSRKPGYLWHANWILGGREVGPAELWERLAEQPEHASRIVHVLMPSPFGVVATFTTLDDPAGNADAIGAVFDAVLETSRPMKDHPAGAESDRRWSEITQDLPRKVQTYTALSLFDPHLPMTVFAA